MEKLKLFFWYCSGVNIALLKKCPTDASKYAGIGATVFFTGIFAAMAGGYALYTVMDDVYWSVAFGVVWGLMIFNLDRYIVSSMRKEGRPWREFALSLPRILLALLISIVIAKPLEMKIFENEIEGELAIMEQQLASRQEQEIRGRYTSQQEMLKNEINVLKKEIQDQAHIRDHLRELARQEADGTGGTGKRNPGPIYQIKKQNADKAEEELALLTERNNDLIREKQQLLATMEANISSEFTGMERRRLAGPAARLEALDRLTEQSEAIALANLFVMLLFIAIETAPVFVKLISPRGPYDNLIKIEEHGFAVQQIEVMAEINSGVKDRAKNLNVYEQEYITNRLDVKLDQS